MSALLNGTPVSLESLWVSKVRSTSSIAALALNVYDWLLGFSDEQRYIWSNWKLNTYIKAMFLGLRYFSLGSQLTLFIWSSEFSSSYPAPESVCNQHHALEIFALVILLNMIDCFFILRAWLLSNRRMIALTLLTTAFFCQLCVVIVSNVMLFPHMDMDGLCMSNPPASIYILSWLSGLIVHTSSWTYTIYQCRRSRKQRWGDTPFVSLLERDGTLCWLSTIATVAIGMVCTYRISTVMSRIIVPWIMTLNSVLGCRMIINIQHLADKDDLNLDEPDNPSVPIELTTNIHFHMLETTRLDISKHFTEASNGANGRE